MDSRHDTSQAVIWGQKLHGVITNLCAMHWQFQTRKNRGRALHRNHDIKMHDMYGLHLCKIALENPRIFEATSFIMTMQHKLM
jgi:hypothetical protein